MRKSRLIASSVCIFSVAIGWQLLNPPAPFLLYNATESAPIGWYALDKKQQFKTGDQVAAFAPEWATSLADNRSYVPAHVPLIKTVWAVAGDEVCRKDGIVTVSNNLNLEAQPHDRVGPLCLFGVAV